jgi:hypothetical protein
VGSNASLVQERSNRESGRLWLEGAVLAAKQVDHGVGGSLDHERGIVDGAKQVALLLRGTRGGDGGADTLDGAQGVAQAALEGVETGGQSARGLADVRATAFRGCGVGLGRGGG